MEKKTIIIINNKEIKELSQELEMDICANSLDHDYGEVYLEYWENNNATQEELALKLIETVNKKYNTEIPKDARILCTDDTGFCVNFIY